MSENEKPTSVEQAMELLRDAQSRAEAAAASPSTALVPTAGTDQALAIKASMVEQRALVLKAQQEVEAAQKAVRDAIEQQRRDAQAMLEQVKRELEPIEKRAKILGEGVHALNIYLGRDEEIETLREGEPAPDTEPVTVRQLVLGMDEESLVAADADGMDYTQVGNFCDWLLADPAHLDQVLPEPKGVVALVPRRQAKDYKDPWVQSAADAENRHTYWLIRNGESLWLTTTDFTVGKHTVPTPQEFTNLFVARTYRGETVRLEPGTREWVEAEERADARTRHYMKVALLLEGLLDRTTVFHPHNGASFLNQADYDAGRIRIILDGENALGTGRKPYREWQREKMEQLSEGMRVIGAFGNRMQIWESKDAHADVRPQGARPDNNVAYTVKSTSRPWYDFQFSFERTDEIYDRNTYEYRAPRTKATGYLSLDMSWVVPIDLVTVEEMTAYLNARTERHQYLNMVPTLRAAIAFKEEEQRREAPFRAALIGRLDGDEAQADELIAWYKTANKWHRPLEASDSKAASLILREATRRKADVDSEVVETLRQSHPAAVVIARRTSDYIVVEPQRRAYDAAEQNVFATTYVYGLRGVLKESREWATLTRAQVAKWTVVHESPAWATWVLNPRSDEHLTDDDIAHLIATVRQAYPEVMLIRVGRQPRHSGGRGLLAVAYLDTGDGDSKYLRPRITREGGEFRFRADYTVSARSHDKPHWETGWSGELKPGVGELFRDEERLAAARVAWERSKAEQQQGQEEHYAAINALRQFEKVWVDAEVERIKARFVDDHGDESLWPAHLEKLRLPRFPYDIQGSSGRVKLAPVFDAIRHAIRNDISLAGMSLREVVEAADGDPVILPEDIADLRWPAADTAGE